MNTLAGILLLLAFRASGFYTLSVDMVDNIIGRQTEYRFGLALDSSYSPFPARYRIDIEFPQTLAVQGALNTLPSTCNIISPSTIVISTVYNPASPSIGQTDQDEDGQCGISRANTVTLINPKTSPVILSFAIGMVQNPSIAYLGSKIGKISIYGYLENESSFSSYISYSFSDNTYKPKPTSLTSFSQDSLNVGGWSTYTFAMQITETIPSNGNIILTFSNVFSLRSAAETQITASVNSGANVNLGVLISGFQVTATGLLPSGAAPGSAITLTISQVGNPRFVGSSLASITTASSSNEDIESAEVQIQAINPCTITLNGYISISQNVIATTQIAIFFSNDVYTSLTTSQFSFKIIFPTTYTIQPTSSCSNTGGLSTSPALVCTVSGNQFTSNLVTQIDKTVSIRLNNIVNPPNNVTTDFVQIYLFTSDNILICRNEKFFRFTAQPNALNINTRLRNTNIVADPGPYSLGFTTATVMPAGGKVRIQLPVDQVHELEGVECYLGSSQVNICTKVTGGDSGIIDLLMTEWCSVSDNTCSNCCRSGTAMSLTLKGVQNPLFSNPSISSSIRIFTYNAAMTGVIDMITNGGQFPAVTTRSITMTSSRSVHLVQLSTAFSFAFTSSTFYTSGSLINIIFPSSAAWPVNSKVVCTNQDSVVGCDYTTNNDGSINTVSIQASTTACTAGTAFSLSLSSLVNPVTISALTGSFRVNARYSGYLIESGVSSSILPSLMTNSLSSFSVIRSSDIVSAVISVTLAFVISSTIPAGGYITIQLPGDFLVINTGLSLYKSGSQLSFIGGLTSFTVQNYCSSACSGGSQISIVLQGVKNPSSVRTITGQMQVETSFGSLIDCSNVDFSSTVTPLAPGTMYNVDIHPIDPTVSSSTAYRLIFTTEHSIPAGSSIEFALPQGPTLITPLSCQSLLTIESSITCTSSGNSIKILNGFSKDYTGSYMIGILISQITNPGSSISFSGFSVLTKDASGLLIDQYTQAAVTYYLPAISCACSKCSGNQCFECLVPSSAPMLQGYSCTSSCPFGTFLLASPALACITCHFTCTSCTSELSSSCLTCRSGYFKSNGFCVPSCPAGTTLINQVCSSISPCTQPCSTCSQDASFCLSCSSGYLFAPTGQCMSACPSGYFISGSICVACSTQCSSCSSDSNSCTSCPVYYLEQILSGSTCVSQCPVGVTVKKGSNCVPCDPTCSTCLDVNSNNCVTCSGSRYLYQATCVFECPSGYRFTGNVCVGTCPDGYFITADSKDCVQCGNNCNTCQTLGSCSSCAGSYYLYQTQCMTDCPIGYVKFEGNLCILTSNCPNGYYVAADRCLKCDSMCATCSDATSCNSCTGSLYLDAAVCKSSCPDGYLKFLDNTCKSSSSCAGNYYVSNEFCSPCDASCSTCSAGLASNCLSCSGSLYFYNSNCLPNCPVGYYQSNTNTCLSSCSAGNYVTPDAVSCLPCDGSCKTCTASTSSSCTSCAAPLYLSSSACSPSCPNGSYKSTQNTCVSSCAAGNYITADSQHCKPCAVTCKTCTGSESQCTSCSGALYLSGAACVGSCPSGYFKYSGNTCGLGCGDGLYVSEDMCLACDGSCKTCTGPSAQQCKTCATEKYFYKNSCYNNCPDDLFSISGPSKYCVTACPSGFYTSSSQCQPCSPACLTCVDNNVCVSCNSGYALSAAYTCLESCPAGYIKVSGKCMVKCSDSNCDICSIATPHQCKICSSGYSLFNLTCVSTCPYGTYSSNSVCTACSATCASCFNSTTCTQCNAGYSLSSLSCVSSCPISTYSSGQVCHNCASGCLSCNNSQVCNQCRDNYYKFNGVCYSSCPAGTYVSNNTCVYSCPDNCTACDQASCVGCKAGYLANGVCVDDCPDGSYQEGDECKSCGGDCAKCQSLTNCLECKVQYLFNGSCVRECPAGTFTNASKCEVVCEEGCEKCDLTGCSQCKNGLAFYMGTCMKCPNDTFEFNSTCIDCQSGCKTCSSSGCMECLYGFLYNGTCINECPESYLPVNGLCESEIALDQSYAVYPLIAEVLIVTILLVVAKFIYNDSYLLIPTALALFSVTMFSAKLALIITIWKSSELAAGVLVPALSGIIVGSASLTVIFMYLYIDGLQMTNAALMYYANEHKFAYFAVRLMSILCGVHFFRMIYSGIYGLSATTEAKSLGTCSRFRYPLEKLSYLNAIMVGIPLALICIVALSIFSYKTDPWQVAAFTLPFTLIIEGYYLISYSRSPWKS